SLPPLAWLSWWQGCRHDHRHAVCCRLAPWPRRLRHLVAGSGDHPLFLPGGLALPRRLTASRLVDHRRPSASSVRRHSGSARLAQAPGQHSPPVAGSRSEDRSKIFWEVAVPYLFGSAVPLVLGLALALGRSHFFQFLLAHGAVHLLCCTLQITHLGFSPLGGEGGACRLLLGLRLRRHGLAPRQGLAGF